jgi:hypothetical protein
MSPGTRNSRTRMARIAPIVAMSLPATTAVGGSGSESKTSRASVSGADRRSLERAAHRPPRRCIERARLFRETSMNAPFRSESTLLRHLPHCFVEPARFGAATFFFWLRVTLSYRIFCAIVSMPEVHHSGVTRRLLQGSRIMTPLRRKDWLSVRKRACIRTHRAARNRRADDPPPRRRADPGLVSVRGWIGRAPSKTRRVRPCSSNSPICSLSC